MSKLQSYQEGIQDRYKVDGLLVTPEIPDPVADDGPSIQFVTSILSGIDRHNSGLGCPSYVDNGTLYPWTLRKRYFKLLIYLGRVLVRRDETVALVPLHLKQDKVQLAAAFSGASSDRGDEPGVSTNDGSIRLGVETSGILPDSEDFDSIRLFLALHKDLAFERHTQIVAKMLRDLYQYEITYHEADNLRDMEEAANTVKEISQNFTFYITLSSIGRIINTFRLGLQQMNFWYFLGMEVSTDLREDYEGICDLVHGLPFYIFELPVHEGGTILFGADMISLFDRTLRQKQSPLTVPRRYDRVGRMQFHGLLRHWLHTAFENSARLENLLKHSEATGNQPTVNPKFEASVRYLSIEMLEALNNLCIITSSKVIRAHLRWIQEGFELKNTNRSTSTTSQAKTQSETIGFNTGTENWMPSMEVLLRAETYVSSLNVVRPEVEGECILETSSANVETKDPSKQIEGQGWAAACDRWLRQLCSTTKAVQKLISCNNPKAREGLSNLYITVVHGSFHGVESETAAARFPSAQDAKLREKLCALLAENKSKDLAFRIPDCGLAPNTLKKVHPEALLISLYILVQDLDMNQIRLKAKELKIPESFLVAVKGMNCTLIVSRPMCPVCYILLRVAEKVSNIAFNHNGALSKYSCCSWPQYLPRAYIKRVEEAMQAEILRVVEAML